MAFLHFWAGSDIFEFRAKLVLAREKHEKVQNSFFRHRALQDEFRIEFLCKWKLGPPSFRCVSQKWGIRNMNLAQASISFGTQKCPTRLKNAKSHQTRCFRWVLRSEKCPRKLLQDFPPQSLKERISSWVLTQMKAVGVLFQMRTPKFRCPQYFSPLDQIQIVCFYFGLRV